MQNKETSLKNLLDYNLEELQEIVATYGQKSYRAPQLYKWLNDGKPYNQMSNLPNDFLSKLGDDYAEGYAEIKQKQVSKDGTIKYLFETFGGSLVESVLMTQTYGNTLCISTQAGCRMGCAFCASGVNGLERNLSAGEILSQVVGAKADGQAVNNIVLMGMGEPFDNYDSVVDFLRRANHDKGLNIGIRSISVSTCGLVPKIIEFSHEGLAVTLAISLHAPNDEIRQQIMPTAKKYTIGEIIDSAKYYFNKTGRRVIIEYILLDGINASTSNAVELAKRLKGLNCHINLIPYNDTAKVFKKPSNETVDHFLSTLKKNGMTATIRKTSGDDIDGACGQLRLRNK